MLRPIFLANIHNIGILKTFTLVKLGSSYIYNILSFHKTTFVALFIGSIVQNYSKLASTVFHSLQAKKKFSQKIAILEKVFLS